MRLTLALLAALTVGCVGGRQLIKEVDLHQRLRAAYDMGLETGRERADAECWEHTQALAIAQYETAHALEKARSLIKELEDRSCLGIEIDDLNGT